GHVRVVSHQELNSDGPDRSDDALTEEELAEPVLGPDQVGASVVTGPDQFTEGLVTPVGNPHPGEVGPAQQARQLRASR
ncbi:MAG: hypothetical protein ACRD6W_11235, partial [Nitrososphaerales archaeon]